MPWKYRSNYIDALDIYILVQREMRDIKGGEAMALLQIIESDIDKQPATWKSIFTQELRNKDILKKIAEHINKEIFMSLVEEIKIEGKIERSREIALEMIKDGMEIDQIVKFTKLPVDEVKKLQEGL